MLQLVTADLAGMRHSGVSLAVLASYHSPIVILARKG